MNRYLVFAGHDYYPSGGVKDLRASYNNKDEAVGYAKGYVAENPGLTWAHVYDTEEDEIVWDSEK